MSRWYVLDGKTPVHEPDLLKAARWFGTADRVVAKTDIGEFQVSTVFLGLDHSYSGPPLLFETMVFGPDDDEMSDYTERCSTWEEAEEQHERVVGMVKESE